MRSTNVPISTGPFAPSTGALKSRFSLKRICPFLTMLLAVVAVGAPSASGAQQLTGGIAGKVLRSSSGEPVSSVNVTIASSLLPQPISVMTDLNGRFTFDHVPVGAFRLTVRRIGFSPKTVTDVVVNDNAVTTMNVTMDVGALQLGSLEVTATMERGSAIAVLDDRRSASAVMDAIGSEQMATLGASDAADVARQMTGLTVAEGRYVYIRGLGDRYSQTSLNRSPLPSPEPEKEVVPLDLFPSDLLEKVSAQKTYTPDRWGDFSGGTIQIETKDFPVEPIWSLGFGTSVNSRSHFGNDFLGYRGGDFDFLGVDDGSRGLPETIRMQLGGLRGARLPSNPRMLERIGEELQRDFTPTTGATPINRSLDATLGSRTRILGIETGFLLGVTYSDEYSVRTDDVESKWRANAFNADLDPSDRIPNIEYTFDRGTRNVRIGSLGNVSIMLTPAHKLSVRTTWNRNSEDEARRYFGLNNEDLGGLVRSDRLRFVQRDLYWGQLSGEHEIFSGHRVDWRGTLARAERDEPALRETIYVNDILADSAAPYFLEPVGESGRYLWSDLVDDDRSFELDWAVPVRVWNRLDATVTVGGAFRDRERDFAARRLTWTFLGGQITNIDSELNEQNIVGSFPTGAQFRLGDIVEPGDQYGATDTRAAGYLMLELPVTESFRVTTGARLETYELLITSRGDTLSIDDDGLTGSVQTTDVLPALSLVFDVTPSVTVRAAASRTLDRPEFRELAPFQFTEAASLRQIFGNPELQPTTIHSYDLRVDLFPRAGELLSASVFYKTMENPIEQTFIAAASTAYSFQNGDRAKLYGVEFDARKRLDFVAPWLAQVMFQGNFSLIESDVTVIESGTFRPTNLNRSLEGQAKYSLNLGLVYHSEYGGTEVGAFLNRQGARITAAGGFGVPDIEATPRNQLDLTVKQRLGRRIRISIKGSNLLDEPYRFVQTANGVTLPQRSYKTGTNLSFGISVEH